MSKLYPFELIVLDSAKRLGWKPLPATAGAAGVDVIAAINKPIKLLPEDIAKLPLGFKLWLKHTYVMYAALLMPRSGNSGDWIFTNSIGLIDSDYQGEWMAKIKNITFESEVTISPGERLGQFIVIPVASLGGNTIKEVTEFSESTERGANGFNSTGRFIK